MRLSHTVLFGQPLDLCIEVHWLNELISVILEFLKDVFAAELVHFCFDRITGFFQYYISKA